MVVGMKEKQAALFQWHQLNDRQQTYLNTIYELDQEAEQVQKQRWFKGKERQSAEVWRWFLYGDVNDAMPSRLKSRLLSAALIDQGTGSTFEALVRRGFIECRGEDPILEVKMTRLGRQIVRAGTHEPIVRATRTPKGMLSAKAWQALALAYWAGKAGLPHEQNYRYRKGIHLSVWDRLRHHVGPAGASAQKPTVMKSKTAETIYRKRFQPFMS